MGHICRKGAGAVSGSVIIRPPAGGSVAKISFAPFASQRPVRRRAWRFSLPSSLFSSLRALCALCGFSLFSSFAPWRFISSSPKPQASRISRTGRIERTTSLHCRRIFRRYEDSAARLAVGGYAEAIAPLPLAPLVLGRIIFQQGDLRPRRVKT